MATLQTSPQRTLLAEQPTIRRSLQQLRRGILVYVCSEFVLLALLAMAGWFLAVFLVDYGLFLLAGVDYVRDGSEGARAGVGVFLFRASWWTVLCATAVYLVAQRFLYRLLVPFRPEALALILERRFPQVLEERLVTAVELADPQTAERYGYSYRLVQYTAQSAEERLHHIPVRRVFNWARLRRLFLGGLGLWASVAALAYFATEWTATCWERNVVWKNRHWPLRVMLMLPDFAQQPRRGVPSGGEMPVRVFAWVNVVRTEDPSYPSGWRPATWADLFPDLENTSDPVARERQQIWELQPPVGPHTWLHILPDSWRLLTLDEVEARHKAMSAQQLRSEAIENLGELGRAVVDYLLPRIADRLAQASETERSLAQPDEETLRWLPKSWHDWSLVEIHDHLRFARRLTSDEVQRRLHSLRRPAGVPEDTALCLMSGWSPLAPPLLTTSTIQQIAWTNGWAEQLPPLTWSSSDWRDLPASWHNLAAAELERRLTQASEHYSLLALGRAVNAQLGELFKELERRADQRHWGRRIYYRRLHVYDQITLEYEELLTEEERRRIRAQVERLPVNRTPGSFEYRYEFRRIERPRRFRVFAGDAVTPWYHIDVRPLPTLRELLRWHREPGYLHNSSDWVERGPIVTALEGGQEIRFDAPIGSQIRLLARTTKPLQALEIALQDQRETDFYAALASQALLHGIFGHPASPFALSANAHTLHFYETRNPFVQQLHFSAGSDEFRVWLRPLRAEELRLVLRFTDNEGIRNSRRLTIVPQPDNEPEFQYANFEIVRREAITPRAIIPFSGLVRDDNGLTEVYYEVTVIQSDGKPLDGPTRIPLRTLNSAITLDSLEHLDLGTGEGLTRWTQPRTVRGGIGNRSVARILPLRTVGSVLASPATALAPLLLAGPLALLQPPVLEPVVEHEFRYEMRPLGAPFLTAQDEFLLTELVPRNVTVPDPNKPGKTITKPLEPPYRLVVRLVAVDNRMTVGTNDQLDREPQRTVYHAAFEFNVVTENDLLIEESRREEEIRERCDNILAKLTRIRDDLVKMRNEAEQLDEDRALRFARDCEDAQRNVSDCRDLVQREIIRDLRLIYRELWFNRVPQKELDRLDEKICRPLEQLVRDGDQFDLTQESIALLAQRLRNERQRVSPANFDPAVVQINLLIERFHKIIQEIKGLIEYAKALEILRDLIKAQERINELLKQTYEKRKREELQP
uniref:Uncharacterized protein n=1 Tax=uncultured Planctomycetota bacterium TaxID=120965 RepID=H5SLZ4_9BACT|nr:hypothetical protein HGMM_F48A06C23 [uncultured Planctomycetota bacterium]